MKKTLLINFLLMLSLVLQAQNEITIEGRLTNVKDGLVIELLREDFSSIVEKDTIENGKFSFKVKLENDLEKMELFVRSYDFPAMSRCLYAKPNACIQVIGTNHLIYTWEVKSDVEEQWEFDRYLYDAKDLFQEFQLLQAEINGFWKIFESPTATAEERKSAMDKKRPLKMKADSIQQKIFEKEIELMKEVPITSVWLDKFYQYSMQFRYRPNPLFAEKMKVLYTRMSEEQKQSELGQLITANIFPPEVVQIGDDMADADLYDLDGNLHHLAELKGKYLLLDFWGSWCGFCLMAFPEMGELQEKYADRLAIVSLSSETEKQWRAASAEHKMTWANWSDKKQTGGLNARYGVGGLPHYVLISPEGKVMDSWSGYGKGDLSERLRPYMEPKPAMTVGEENGVLWVNYPDVQTNQTNGTLEIKRVERTLTETVIYFKVRYNPKEWIKLSKETELKTSDGKCYKVLKTYGITLGEELYMPESGEAEFSVTFEPLPLDAKTFDFQEGEGEGSWKMKNIRLVK